MINLGILDAGVYNLTLRIVDVAGNFATDTVFIVVNEPTTTTTTTTSEPSTPTPTEPLPFANITDFQGFVTIVTLGMILMGGMIAILILANVMLFQRFRSSKS